MASFSPAFKTTRSASSIRTTLTAPNERNVIAANTYYGIFMGGSTTETSRNLVAGNYIGTDATGLHPLGNMLDGILMDDSVTNTTIGGTTAGAGNVISTNGRAQIHVSGATGTFIQGNLIGTDARNQNVLGNPADGIDIENASAVTIAANTIAGCARTLA